MPQLKKDGLVRHKKPKLSSLLAEKYGSIENFFNEGIPFNKFLGIEILELSPDYIKTKIDFRPELVGDPVRQVLHGGLTATLIDVTGGALAFATVDISRLRNISTIDMRIDYLRPGKGKTFYGEAEVIRRGNRICVNSITVRNEYGALIATGVAAYNIALKR